MSKIVEEIRDQIAREIGDSNQPAVYTVPEFNKAVRLAYNLALDDASEKVGERGDPEWSWRYQDWIDDLKI